MRSTHGVLLPRAALALSLLLSCGHLAQGAPPDPEALAKGLVSHDEKDRSAAADALGDLGAAAKSVGPALVTALKDPSPAVRWRAAALASVGASGNAARDALVAGLRDEDATVRAYSAFALGTLGFNDKPAIEAIAVLVADKDPVVRRSALKSLRLLKLPRSVTIPLFVKTLSSADPAVAMTAVQTIAAGGESSVAFLRDALAEPKAAYWACLALAEIGPAAKEATPQITKLVASKEALVRFEACMALAAIGPPAKEATLSLAKVLTSDPVPGVRYAAAYAIGGIGAPDPAVVEALKKVGDSDPFLTTICAWAVARLNPKDADQVSKAVTLLVDGLKSPKAPVRLASVRALEQLNPSADVVGPALVTALKDSDPEIASEAIDVLGSLGPTITPEIVKALSMPNLRSYALQILARFGADAKLAVPDLIALLDDPKTEKPTRREINFALGQIGPAAAPATPQLIKSLGSDSERVRNRAIFALGRIGPGATSATPALEKMAASDDDFVHIASLWALVQINPTDANLAAKAAPELIKGLASERDMMRAESARVLGGMGSVAKIALPALKKQAASDSNAQASEAAKKAIAQIESGKTGSSVAPTEKAPIGANPANAPKAAPAAPPAAIKPPR